jgi:hypothetical protein
MLLCTPRHPLPLALQRRSFLKFPRPAATPLCISRSLLSFLCLLCAQPRKTTSECTALRAHGCARKGTGKGGTGSDETTQPSETWVGLERCLTRVWRVACVVHSKHRADAARNGYRYNVLRGQAWDKVQSGELAVGDLVKVMQNEMIPADMIIIGSALAQGDCFIDKANLNGETRLEVVSSLIPTRDWCTDETEYYIELAKKKKADNADPANAKPDPPLPPLTKLSTFKAEITFEPPNKNFDTFRGVCTVEGLPARKSLAQATLCAVRCAHTHKYTRLSPHPVL